MYTNNSLICSKNYPKFTAITDSSEEKIESKEDTTAMKKMKRVCGILVLAAVVLSCQSIITSAKDHFTAQLTGDQQVPPVKTDATGEARFAVDPNNNAVYYTIVVNNLRDVTMAHIHFGKPGANGNVVVWLYPSSQPPKEITGVFSGTLASGSFTADSIVGSMKGKSIADFMTELRAGNLYVNVHTKQNPGGEIRGQIH